MVKFRYSDNKACHAKFLNCYMTQKYKKEVSVKPQLFGNVTKEQYEKLMMNQKIVTQAGKKKTISRHFKWILSPEANLDEESLKQYTKLFVSRLEQTTGQKFIWQAAVHLDTDHHHVHLLINGLDADGKEIKGFSKDVIQNYAREFSQEILTRMCGERDNEIKRKAREKRITAYRFTEFDKAIKNLMDKDNLTEDYEGYINDPENGEIKQRLIFLKENGMADLIGGTYFLKKNFEEKLRTVGRYNIFKDAEQYARNGDLKLYKKGEAIEGKIKKIYTMNDEDVWSNGCVIENEKTGEVYFIPSFKPIRMKNNDYIKVSTIKNESGKENIVIEKIKENKTKTNDYKKINTIKNESDKENIIKEKETEKTKADDLSNSTGHQEYNEFENN